MPKGENLKWKWNWGNRWDRSSQAAIEVRVAQIANMLIAWNERFEILPVIKKEYWLSDATIDSYIKRAFVRISQEDDEDIMVAKKKAEQRYNYIYKHCIRNKKRDSAIRAQKWIVDLKWLEAPKKIDLSWKLNIWDVVAWWDNTVREYLSKRWWSSKK